MCFWIREAGVDNRVVGILLRVHRRLLAFGSYQPEAGALGEGDASQEAGAVSLLYAALAFFVLAGLRLPPVAAPAASSWSVKYRPEPSISPDSRRRETSSRASPMVSWSFCELRCLNRSPP